MGRELPSGIVGGPRFTRITGAQIEIGSQRVRPRDARNLAVVSPLHVEVIDINEPEWVPLHPVAHLYLGAVGTGDHEGIPGAERPSHIMLG